LVWDGV